MSGCNAPAAFIAVLRRDLHVYLSYRTRLVSQLLTCALQPDALLLRLSARARQRLSDSPASYFGVRRRRHRAGRRPLLVLLDPRTRPPGARRGHLRTAAALPVRRDAQRRRDDAVPAAVRLRCSRRSRSASAAPCSACSCTGRRCPSASRRWRSPCSRSCPFGLLFAALTVAAKQGSVGTSWVIALISIVGGLYFPVSLLPDWAQTRNSSSRSRPATGAAPPPAGRRPAGISPCDAIAKLALFAGVLLPASLLALASDPRRPALGERSSSTEAAQPQTVLSGDRFLLASRLSGPSARRLPHLPGGDGGAQPADGQVPRPQPHRRSDARGARGRARCSRRRRVAAREYRAEVSVVRADVCYLCRTLLERGLIELDAPGRRLSVRVHSCCRRGV